MKDNRLLNEIAEAFGLDPKDEKIKTVKDHIKPLLEVLEKRFKLKVKYIDVHNAAISIFEGRKKVGGFQLGIMNRTPIHNYSGIAGEYSTSLEYAYRIYKKKNKL